MTASRDESAVAPRDEAAHERARPWTLRRRNAMTFGVLGALVAALVAAVIVSTVIFVQASNSVIYRWQPAVIAVERLTLDLVDQETGLRGYVLSRNETFLAPYDAAVKSEAQHAVQLRQHAEDDYAVRARIDALLAAASVWQHSVASPAIKLARTDRAAAARLVESVEAKQDFDLIRTRATALSDEVAHRTRAARSASTVAGVIFVVALSLAGLVVILGGLLLWRGLRRWVLVPIGRLGRQTRVVASGDTHREIEPFGPVELTELGRDVELMRRRIAEQLLRAEEAREELRVQGAELARSNEDLQQFAYVASHDLSEPLRKVANFCQLLERQYADQLDDRARQYIDFAVDGAKRMQTLITDLLSFSRVSRSTEQFTDVPFGQVVHQAERTLGDKIFDTGATIIVDDGLPSVHGDRTLLVSLMENLIGNAMKYRRSGVTPMIRIGAEVVDGMVRVRVADNGIGIDPQYAERIFAVFQRLHLRDQYDGTGIGLALCRRIVEFHGGQIGLAPVESSASEGATFEFTLPEGAASDEPPDLSTT